MKRKGDQVSINVFEIIDEICREFRKDWKANGKADISKYLYRVDENARPMLFRNLLNTEYKFRTKNGESPTSSDYLKRFPQFAQIIRQEFDESTMGSFELAEGTPEDSAGTAVVEPASAIDSEADQTRTFEELAASRLGDYELIRELGRGGFGVVYEARHVKQQNRVALKTLPTGTDGQEVNADRLHKFRKEFRTLSEINHPNLVGMQTLEFDGTQWFFTMDLVKGTDFLSYVRPKDWLDEKHLRASIKQLAAGIMALHDKGIVHRDLKPSNVLVEPNGRVVILDFGLVAQLQQNPDMTATKSAMFAGTPRYAAPEQMFGQRSEASDWYAMGVMLYEALKGEPPFPGRNPMEVLQQKQNEDPPTLSGRDDIPTDLATLADTLLRREPSQRATTSHIAQELKLDLESTKHPSAGSTDSEGVEIEAFPEEEIELIGREKQLAQLEAAKQQLLETRKPVVCWITGLSGEGKSALAEKFLAPIRRGKEMLVLSGRCYDRESVPFKAIDSIIDPLTSFLRAQSTEWHNENIPQDFRMLAQLFPILNRVKGISKPTDTGRGRISERQVRYRAFYALRELFKNIGKTTAIVIFLDDLQWGDSDSAEVIIELLRPPSNLPILFVGSYRSDESENSPFIQEWADVTQTLQLRIETREIFVHPLSESQCLQLLLSRVGPSFSRLNKQSTDVFIETQGNPYFVEQLIDGFDSNAETFERIPLDQVISRKLTRLPEEAIKLLQVIAIAGHAISLEEASKVCGVALSSYSIITHMRSERLVRLIGTSATSMVDTYHDKIRETVLEGLNERVAKGWHSSYADFLESENKLDIEEIYHFFKTAKPTERCTNYIDRAYDLAYHFGCSGNKRKAFAYSLVAAEQAAVSYANDEAAVAYAHAEEILPPELDSRIHYRLCLGIGQTHRRSNRTNLAIPNLEKAVELATNPHEKALACAEIGNIYDQLGRPTPAFQMFDKALGHINVRRPRTVVGKLLSILWNSFRTISVPASWQKYRNAEKRRYALLRESIFRRVWLSLIENEGLLAAFDSCLRSSIAGFQSGELNCVSRSYTTSAVAWSGNGSRWLGNLFLARSKKLIAQIDDPESRGANYFAFGMSRYWLGNLEDSRQAMGHAMEELEKCGEFADQLLAMHICRHIETYIGTTTTELNAAEDVRNLAYEVGNAQRTCWGEYDVAAALARRGDLPNALTSMANAFAALKGDQYIHTESIRESTHAYVMLQCSEPQKSTAFSAKAWENNLKSFVFVDTAMFCVPLIVESIIGPNWIDPLDEQKQKPLKRALRRANIFFWTLPNHQPHLLRVAGRAAITFGNRQKATKKFTKAVKLSSKKGMDYQRAKCLLDLAAVKEAGRDENRAEAIELLKKMESVIPRAESWLLGDQYDEAVVAPEFDLAAWEKENGPVTPYLNELEKAE